MNSLSCQQRDRERQTARTESASPATQVLSLFPFVNLSACRYVTLPWCFSNKHFLRARNIIIPTRLRRSVYTLTADLDAKPWVGVSAYSRYMQPASLKQEYVPVIVFLTFQKLLDSSAVNSALTSRIADKLVLLFFHVFCVWIINNRYRVL